MLTSLSKNSNNNNKKFNSYQVLRIEYRVNKEKENKLSEGREKT